MGCGLLSCVMGVWSTELCNGVWSIKSVYVGVLL